VSRTAWFGCSAGVAGDMLLGALVDAGADPDDVAHAIGGLGVDGIAITFERVQRCGVGATRAIVVVHLHGDDRGDEHAGDHPHRPARDVLHLIAAADLPPRVADRAIRVYRTIAEVEGRIHGIDPDDVELHEVGALDSIADVVGVCAALESLGIDTIACSPIAVGHGSVRTAHGELPNPAPAVVELLARSGAAVRGIDTTMELATPTGVGLITELASSFGPIPTMTVAATGFGAGSADPAGRPNVVQVVIGETTPAGAAIAGSGRPAVLVSANVDDVTPEVLAHTVGRLLAIGAFDAWVAPIVMKKGRPAHTVHALCDDAALPTVAEVIRRETGTLGLRAHPVERWPQRRAEQIVDVDGHSVRVKVAADGHVKVEHDDAVAAAAALGRPLRDILDRAVRLAGG
jgi:pyridinium-3,5-bisthiocarboxylic acid mononucleotide nickel chelatase